MRKETLGTIVKKNGDSSTRVVVRITPNTTEKDETRYGGVPWPMP